MMSGYRQSKKARTYYKMTEQNKTPEDTTSKGDSIPLIEEVSTTSEDSQDPINSFLEEETPQEPETVLEEPSPSEDTGKPDDDSTSAPTLSKGIDMAALLEKATPFLKKNGIYILLVIAVSIFVVPNLIPPSKKSAGSFESTNQGVSISEEPNINPVQAQETAPASPVKEKFEPVNTVATNNHPVNEIRAETTQDYFADNQSNSYNTLNQVTIDPALPLMARFDDGESPYLTKEAAEKLFTNQMNRFLQEDRTSFIGFKRNVEGQMQSLMKLVYALREDVNKSASDNDFKAILDEVGKISNEVDKRSAKTAQKYKNIDGRLEKIESMPINTRPVKGTVAKAPRRPTVSYRLVSAMDGRAWIRDKSGELEPLEVGDRLKGYGQILKIVPEGGGHIHTVSGEVSLIRNN